MQNLEDLAALLFSPDSLQLHVEQAIAVLESSIATPDLQVAQDSAASAADAAGGSAPAGASPSRAVATTRGAAAEDGTSGACVCVVCMCVCAFLSHRLVPNIWRVCWYAGGLKCRVRLVGFEL